MKKLVIIFLVSLIYYKGQSQDSCLPRYSQPVKSVKLSTGKLAYTEQGKGDCIVFIHGLGGNISHWEKITALLSDNYKCIVVDLPGYGWSDKLKNPSVDDRLQVYANVIKEFLKKKKIKSYNLAGHSMGAQIATIITLQDKRVKKLMLMAPAGIETFSDKEGQFVIAATQPALLEKQEEAVIRNNFKINFVQPPLEMENLIQDRLRMKRCQDYKSYCETVSAGVKGMLSHPVKDSLQFISIPTLIVFGDKDALIPNRYFHATLKTADLGLEAARLVKKGESKLLPDAGHMLQYEKPAELSVLIKEFLQ